ncbi:hypothetical protein FRB97_009257 [Tulasnella sp. 331]|nr:hypothetical protein FRB97_009257 [Tulasnella sp. 331]KAG8873482.1 hypothetical protein FRB98_009006 [Tulasnella sp. 332]
MASKQLGKLKQWAGEVVSSNKTTVTDEFKELETDVELRRGGVERIHTAAEAYHKAIVKKIEVEGESDKVFPIEALGLVLISHGNDFGAEAAFGQSLGKLGRAHCKIAQLQEEYAQTFEETFLASLTVLREVVKDYSAQRKKLDSRRLTLDAAISKAAKMKKEKEKKEADEELRTAKSRYEETSEQVQARMYDIQDGELQQFRDLTDLLELELSFVSRYQELLTEVRKDWFDESAIQHVNDTRHKVATHAFVHQPDLSEPEPEVGRERRGSIKSKAPKPTHEKSDSITSEKTGLGLSRWGLGSLRGRKDSKSSKNFKAFEDELDEDVRGDHKISRADRLLRGGDEHGKADMDDIIDRSPAQSLSKLHARSRSGTASRPPIAALTGTANRPPLPSRTSATSSKRIVKALYDFTATSADELSFEVGDEIMLMSEVSEGWWKGERNDGKIGVFPLNHTEEVRKPVPPPRPVTQISIGTSQPRLVPPPPPHDGASSDDGEGSVALLSRRPSTTKSQKSFTSRSRANSRAATEIPQVEPPSPDMGSRDHDEPFGDHYERNDEMSGMSDDDMGHGKVLQTASPHDLPVVTTGFGANSTAPSLPSRPRAPSSSLSYTNGSQGKKPPPPPPPASRRTPSTTTASLAPSQPQHNTAAISSLARRAPFRSKSSSALPTRASEALLSKDEHSPFAHAQDPSGDQQQQAGGDAGFLLCAECGCDDFVQNPFKQTGHCSSCFHSHA